MIINFSIFLNASFSIVWIDDGRTISVNDVHPSNADDPINVIEFMFNSILVNDVQFLNESRGMHSIFPSIVNDLTPWKALFSIVLIDDGSVISVKDVHCSKVELDIFDIVDGRTILVIEEHPLKAAFSIFLIDCGIAISTNDEHPSNADDPIDTILSVLNVIFVSEVQFLNELFGIFAISPLMVNSLIPRNELVPI